MPTTNSKIDNYSKNDYYKVMNTLTPKSSATTSTSSSETSTTSTTSKTSTTCKQIKVDGSNFYSIKVSENST